MTGREVSTSILVRASVCLEDAYAYALEDEYAYACICILVSTHQCIPVSMYAYAYSSVRLEDAYASPSVRLEAYAYSSVRLQDALLKTQSSVCLQGHAKHIYIYIYRERERES